LPVLRDLPVLVLVGDRDLITPPDHSRAIAAELPDAELVVLENAGHMVMLERAALATLHLRTFLHRAHRHAGGTGQRRRRKACYVGGPRRSRARSVVGPRQSRARSVVRPRQSRARSVVRPGQSRARSVVRSGTATWRRRSESGGSVRGGGLGEAVGR